MRKRAKPKRWSKDPSSIYRVMVGQQPFTPSEQATLALPVREALQSFRDGTATDNHWHTLALITNVCLLRGQQIAPEVVDVAIDGQDAMLRIAQRKQRTGTWGLSHDDMVALDACIDIHEQLIELSTPAQMKQTYQDTLARLQAGNVRQLSPAR